MKISADVFEAFLKCSTKCWLRAAGEPASGNAYAEWVQTQNESYRAGAAKRLTADVPANECDVAPVAENLKSTKWRLAVNVLAETPETKPRSSRGNEAQTSTSEISQSLRTSAATNDQTQPKWITKVHWH